MPKTYEYKGKLFCEIPADVASALGLRAGDDLEFKRVYEKLVVVVPASGAIGEDETAILRKLNTIKYSERTVEKSEAMFAPAERELLKSMIERGMVYGYQKEGKMLLGISKDYYRYAMGAPAAKAEELPAREAPKGIPASPVPKEASREDELLAKLEKDGYLVLENEGMAQLLTQKLKSQGRDAGVEGVRGFDKKFYVIKREKLADFESRLTKALKGSGKKLDDIAEALSLDAGLCRAGMEVLREQGKVIEKRKGMYGLA